MIEKILSPLLTRRKLYYGYVHVIGKLLKFRARKGIKVLEEDWDNLIVLDACRYDKFAELNHLEGDLRKVRSKATATPQWLKRNFERMDEDVIYVTGNPYIEELSREGYFRAEDHFFHIENLWKSGWDDDLDTVPPEPINEAFLELREKYPEKRFIVHYMQPHEPFIGRTDLPGERRAGWGSRWKRFNQPEMREAYEDNLRHVLRTVEDVVERVEGKTVITGDHGEIIGSKFGFITHPKDVFIKDLYTVPWFEVSGQASE